MSNTRNIATIALAAILPGLATGQVGPRPELRPRYDISDGGMRRSFTIALDEIGIRRGGHRTHATVRAANAPELARMIQTERTARLGTGDEVEPIARESGKEVSDLARRFITRRITAELDNPALATQMATSAGLRLIALPPYAPKHAVFEASSPEAALAAMEALRLLPGLKTADVQLAHPRQKKLTPNDPLFPSQWHLRNTTQTGGALWMDANVTRAWDSFRGTGITIGIVDDGVQHTHPDLSPNYNTAIDHDFIDNDEDAAPGSLSSDTHGTQVAGVAAARGSNGVGVAGVAFEATLTGLRLLSDSQTDQDEADAFAHRNDVIQVKNNSWGAPDDGASLDGPDALASAALLEGTTTGRGGRGTIYVFAAGNGLASHDDSNADGYANSIHVIAVSAVGESGFRSWYSEPGANILVSAPSSGGFQNDGITTTDLLGSNGASSSDYSTNFGGTSSASPLVAGVCALMLQANTNLGWRDVQEILVRTARRPHIGDLDWATNGAGLLFNHKYGAGIVDAYAAVTMAQTWANLGPYTNAAISQTGLNVSIPDDSATGITRSFDFGGSTNLRVERVAVTLTATHPFRGDLEIILTSPSGMRSQLMTQHSDGGANYNGWTFTSVRHWGENAAGTWTAKIADRAYGDAGKLNALTVRLYGSTIAGPDFATSRPILLSEANLPTNGVADPGELVTFDFPLRNIGNATVSNLTATLLPIGGVSEPGAPQSYGSLAPGAGPATRPFAFRCGGTSGSSATPTLRIDASGQFVGYATYALPLGKLSSNSFSGSALIIQDNNIASPYPSSISVSGLTGRVHRATARLTGFSHTRPNDIGVILDGAGQLHSVLFDDATATPVSSRTYTFDDDAAVLFPSVGSSPSGSYRTINHYSTSGFPNLPTDEPAYSLCEFCGVPPNGSWGLYVKDFFAGYSGSISGWRLDFTMADCTDNVFLISTNAVVGESAGTATVQVMRTGGREGTGTVHFATSNGSATAGADYTAASGTLTFAPGEIIKSFAVPILNDGALEPPETIQITLSNAGGNTRLGSATSGTVTIIDGDSDLDGIPDDYETSNGLNPNSPADADDDPDGDGRTNLQEFQDGTNPQSHADALRLRVYLVGDDLQIQVDTVAGNQYQVFWSEDLLTWHGLGDPVTAIGASITLTDPGAALLPKRFYRAQKVGP